MNSRAVLRHSLKCPTLIFIYFIFKIISTFFLLIRPPIVGIIILNRLAKFSLAIYSIIFSSEFGQGVHRSSGRCYQGGLFPHVCLFVYYTYCIWVWFQIEFQFYEGGIHTLSHAAAYVITLFWFMF